MDHPAHSRSQHQDNSLSPNTTPPVSSFDEYLQEFKDPITPYDIEIPVGEPGEYFWTVAACPSPNGRRCPGCNGFKRHNDQIIVGIDGACRNNGLPNAEASIGVFFGHNSKYNLRERIIDGPITSQRAELIATSRALEQVQSFCSYEYLDMGEEGSLFNAVVFKSDSAYVVNGLTQWVWKWERNGYRTTQGTPVVNIDLFQQLVKQIYQLKESGLQIEFWKVDREFNQEADWLANDALDS